MVSDSAMDDVTPSGPRPVRALTLAVIVVAMVAAAAISAAWDDAAGRPSLTAVAPLMVAVAAVGSRIAPSLRTLLIAAAAAAAVLLLTLAIIRSRRPNGGRWAALLAGTGLALAGQAGLAVGWSLAGAAVYVCAVVLVWLSSPPGASPDLVLPAAAPESGPRKLLRWEAWGLVGTIAIASMFRFVALNRVVNSFEGELSPFLVGATNVPGWLLANAGVGGPWAPLGLLYYAPVRLGVAIAGTSVVAVRIGSAVAAIAAVVAAFLLAREIASRSAGLAAAAILALDPLQIGWGRSDVHPHGATAWPCLLLAWTTVLMVRTRKTRWFVATALLMALCWHQYPSGQFAFLLPLLVILGLAIDDRGSLRAMGWRILLLPAGVAGWLLGYPVTEWLATGRWVWIGDYMRHLGPRLERPHDLGSLAAYLVLIGQHLSDLAAGILVAVPRLFHQTFLPDFPHLTVRALPWAVAAMAVVGLVLILRRPRRPEAWVLLALLATSALPALLSDFAYVKRASVLYPALEVVAAIACATVARVCGLDRRRWLAATVSVTLLAGWTVLASWQWFSGERYPWGRPPEETIADAVADRLEPGTLVVASFWDDYMVGKFTYLLLDDLQSTEVQPTAWVIARPYSKKTWRELPEHPLAALDGLEAQRPYLAWSGLADDIDRWQAVDDWRRLVVLAQEEESLDAWVERLRVSCPSLTVASLQPSWEEKHHFRLIVCDDFPGLAN
jgi:hypothetical protein